jgi:hypothetical protein
VRPLREGAAVVTVRRRVPPPRTALGVLEAAESLGVGHAFFKEHIAPELRWVRRGGRKLVPLRSLEAWLEQNAQQLPPELLGDDERGAAHDP